jgi:hypothetical protein
MQYQAIITKTTQTIVDIDADNYQDAKDIYMAMAKNGQIDLAELEQNNVVDGNTKIILRGQEPKRVPLDIDVLPNQLYIDILEEFKKQYNLSDDEYVISWDISATIDVNGGFEVSDSTENEQSEDYVSIYKDGTKVYEGQTFGRECSITGEGMDEGWVVNGGHYYFKYEADAEAFVKREWGMTLEEAYDDDKDTSDGFYWTEFEDSQYVIVDGKLTDVDELEISNQDNTTPFKLQNKEVLTITSWDVEYDNNEYTITHNPDQSLAEEWTIICDYAYVTDNELKTQLINFCKSNNN